MIQDDDEGSLTAKLKNLAASTKGRDNGKNGGINGAEQRTINNNAVEKDLSINRSNMESNSAALTKLSRKKHQANKVIWG